MGGGGRRRGVAEVGGVAGWLLTQRIFTARRRFAGQTRGTVQGVGEWEPWVPFKRDSTGL